MANNKALKHALIFGSSGLAIYGGLKYHQLKKAVEMLSFSVPKVTVRDKGLEYIRLLMDIDIQNPSDKALDLELQTAKVYYGDTEVGNAPARKISLPPNKTTKLENVEAQINPKRLGKLALALLTQPLDQITASILPNLKLKIFLKISKMTHSIELGINQAPKQIGLVAAGKRDIKDGSRYGHLIDRPTGKTREVQKYGGVDDTVKWAGYVVKKYHKQVQRLADFLQSKSGTKKELFRNIFDFCYGHIQYHLDRPGVEELRTPAMTWHDRRHGVDCDDFTMFVASILHCLGIPFEFRITKYGGKPNYQHIYLIVPIENGRHITIDPVLDTFNYEKPFSDHKDYDMKSLNLAGTDGLGIPIEILAGTATGPGQQAANLENIYKVATGYDLQGVFNGLGSAGDDSQAMLRHLKRLRNVYADSPEYIADYQDPAQAVKMLDYAIKYWDTDKRQAALDKLAKIEDELIEQGQINLEGFDDEEGWTEDTGYSGTEPELSGFEYRYPDQVNEWEEDIAFSGTEPELAGFEYRYPQPEWEEDYSFSGTEQELPDYEYDYSIDGLAGRRRRRLRIRKPKIRLKRLKKAVRKIRAKRPVRGMFKKLSKGIKKGVKFAARSIVKASATPLRLALLTALRTNVKGISDKFKYAYLTEQQAIAKGIDAKEYRKLKEAHSKLEKMFKKFGGKGSALKKAILSGKRKNLRGFEQVGDTISGITELDGWEQDTGYTGTEPENPQNEYRYDNQIWRVDEQFSGFETESPNYDYDYSFDGLEGRRIRFRRRKSPKRRWFKRLFRRNKGKQQSSVTSKPVAKKKKRQFSEAAGELLENVQANLKTVQFDKVLEKWKIKKDFLDAFANNHGHISTMLAYGLKTQQQAVAEGVSSTDYQKIRNALQTAHAAIKDYGGTAKEVTNAILIGKDKANLDGLGAVVAAAGAAAGLIGKIVSWIKDIKLKKQAKKQAKASYTASGGSKEGWKAGGKQLFKTQWAEQMKTAGQSTPATAQATTAATTAQKGAYDFTEIIKEKVGEKLKSAANAAIPVPETTTIPATTGEEAAEGEKGFWEKHKKKVLIGGGILAMTAMGYGIYKHNQNKKEEGQAQSNTNPKTLSGTGKGRRAGTRKTPAKRRAAHGKVVAVTLR